MNRMVFQFIKQRPRKSWKDWLVFALMMALMLPLLLLMLVLLPVFLLYQVIKWKFWAKKQQSMMTPMGLMVNEQGHWRQIMWPQIDRGEVWLQDGQEIPVVKLKDGQDVLLNGMPKANLQQALTSRGIPFDEQSVVVG